MCCEVRAEQRANNTEQQERLRSRGFSFFRSANGKSCWENQKLFPFSDLKKKTKRSSHFCTDLSCSGCVRICVCVCEVQCYVIDRHHLHGWVSLCPAPPLLPPLLPPPGSVPARLLSASDNLPMLSWWMSCLECVCVEGGGGGVCRPKHISSLCGYVVKGGRKKKKKKRSRMTNSRKDWLWSLQTYVGKCVCVWQSGSVCVCHFWVSVPLTSLSPVFFGRTCLSLTAVPQAFGSCSTTNTKNRV